MQKVYPAVILYSNKDFFQTSIEMSRLPSGVLRWVADYGVSDPGFPNWAFWQYSDSGIVTGVNGTVDLDYFRGTLTDLQKLTQWEKKSPVSIVPATPVAATVNGQSVQAYAIDGETYLNWAVLQLWGFKAKGKPGSWNFVGDVVEGEIVDAAVVDLKNALRILQG
jgi:hypothetical protein